MKSINTLPAVLLIVLGSGPACAQDHTIVEVKRRTTHKTWKRYETVTLRHIRGFTPREIPLSRFGGRADMKTKATGFFRTEKIDGRWWIVDPEGHPWYSAGCCAVRPNPTPQGRRALEKMFGTEAKWAQAVTDQLRDNGFNNLGCWSHWEKLRETTPRLPYTTQSNFMSRYGKKRGGTYQKPGHTGYPNDCIFVFDPEFATFCEANAKEMLAPVRDDPFCLGHFSDNEMPFRDNALDRYMELKPDDPGRRAAEKWIAGNGVKKSGKGYAPKDREAFLGHLADTYFGIVSRAIRKADPNHLYLGSRFHGGDLRRRTVVQGAGPYVDIVSFNWYGAWTPDSERMDNWIAWSGKPFIITEWYAKGMDSGMTNISGAGFTVKTQTDRGRFYQNFTLALLKHPGCVGWHWFKYMDNDPTNLKTDPSNRDSNKGFVNYLYEPWTDLLTAMKQINTQVYALRDHLCR